MLGSHGGLGTVVGIELMTGDVDVLIVRGGMSEALVYYVPSERIVEVSTESSTVLADADVADFVPHLRDDGTVVLHLSR